MLAAWYRENISKRPEGDRYIFSIDPPIALEIYQPTRSLPIATSTIDQAYAYAEVNSPLVRAAQSREKISRAGVEAARAEMGPRIDLRG